MANPDLIELADKIPALVKAGIRGLADDERLGLAIALVEGGKMTFSEIKAKYGLNPSTLSSHLSALQSGNLVRNYYERGIGRAYSYYEATELPEAVIGALLTSVYGSKTGEERPPYPDGCYPWTLRGGGEDSPGLQSRAAAEPRTRVLVQTAMRPPSIAIPDNDTGGGAQSDNRVYGAWSRMAGEGHSAARGV